MTIVTQEERNFSNYKLTAKIEVKPGWYDSTYIGITDLLSNFCVQTLKSRDLLRKVSKRLIVANKLRFFICKV